MAVKSQNKSSHKRPIELKIVHRFVLGRLQLITDCRFHTEHQQTLIINRLLTVHLSDSVLGRTVTGNVKVNMRCTGTLHCTVSLCNNSVRLVGNFTEMRQVKLNSCRVYTLQCRQYSW